MNNKETYKTNVYIHRNSFTKEIFYVGIGSTGRSNDNKKRSLHWQRYVAKYGRTVEIIFSDLLWKEACQIEIYLIRYYGRLCDTGGILLNKTLGGEGAHGSKRPDLALRNKGKRFSNWNGKKHTEESKRKMGQAKKRNGFVPWNKGLKNVQPKWTEEQRNKRIAWLTGRKHSEETKLKMSASGKGKIRSEDFKAKMRGIPKSEETKKKLSLCRKGKSISDEHRIKIGIGSAIAWAKRKQQKTA